MTQEHSQSADVHTVRVSSETSQRALTAFHTSVSEHIAAIQTAARELLPEGADEAGPSGIRVEIAVGPDPGKAGAQYNSVDCWDEDVICGKGQTGYIHCTVHVCMVIGPITEVPG